MRCLDRAWGRWAFIALLAMTLTACKEQLHSRVSEREANEMVATLYVAGIRADKVAKDEKSWAVEVERADVQRGLMVLQEHGLPKEQFANTGELFKKEGLVSTPSEERIRYMYAVSQELSRTLSEIDGVITARVHLVMPANDPLSSRVRPSSASIFIKHRSSADLQSLSPAIKNLVMRGIEGLDYENISLTFIAGEEPRRPSVAMPPVIDTTDDLVHDYGGVLGAIVSLIGAVCLGFLWSRARERQPGLGRQRTAPTATSKRSADPHWSDAPSMNWLSRALHRRRRSVASDRDRVAAANEDAGVFAADAPITREPA